MESISVGLSRKFCLLDGSVCGGCPDSASEMNLILPNYDSAQTRMLVTRAGNGHHEFYFFLFVVIVIRLLPSC